jgi:DnaJ-class molecular chaperone
MGMIIPLVDALVGFETNITHVDGRIVAVRKNSVTSCGSVMRIAEEGMPRRGGGNRGFGDLIITFTVQFPEHIRGSDKARIADVFKHY